MQVRDPESTVIFSKLEQNDAELMFKTRVAGRHTFCLTLSRKSAARSKKVRTRTPFGTFCPTHSRQSAARSKQVCTPFGTFCLSLSCNPAPW